MTAAVWGLLIGSLVAAQNDGDATPFPAGYYTTRVEDFFQSTPHDAFPAPAPSPFEAPLTETPRETEIDKALSARFYRVVRDVFEKILWTSVGWTLGMALPVTFLAAWVALAKYWRRQAEKIQNQVLSDQLAIQRRHTVELTPRRIERRQSSSEIVPASPSASSASPRFQPTL